MLALRDCQWWWCYLDGEESWGVSVLVPAGWVGSVPDEDSDVGVSSPGGSDVERREELVLSGGSIRVRAGCEDSAESSLHPLSLPAR